MDRKISLKNHIKKYGYGRTIGDFKDVKSLKLINEILNDDLLIDEESREYLTDSIDCWVKQLSGNLNCQQQCK